MSSISYAELDHLIGEILPERTALSTVTDFSGGAPPGGDVNLDVHPRCGPEVPCSTMPEPAEPQGGPDVHPAVHPRCGPDVPCEPDSLA